MLVEGHRSNKTPPRAVAPLCSIVPSANDRAIRNKNVTFILAASHSATVTQITNVKELWRRPLQNVGHRLA
jgi:hypothetical protein